MDHFLSDAKSIVFASEQDFADLNYLDIIVKASLQLDVSKQNTLLPNAETQVSCCQSHVSVLSAHWSLTSVTLR